MTHQSVGTALLACSIRDRSATALGDRFESELCELELLETRSWSRWDNVVVGSHDETQPASVIEGATKHWYIYSPGWSIALRQDPPRIRVYSRVWPTDVLNNVVRRVDHLSRSWLEYHFVLGWR